MLLYLISIARKSCPKVDQSNRIKWGYFDCPIKVTPFSIKVNPLLIGKSYIVFYKRPALEFSEFKLKFQFKFKLQVSQRPPLPAHNDHPPPTTTTHRHNKACVAAQAFIATLLFDPSMLALPIFLSSLGINKCFRHRVFCDNYSLNRWIMNSYEKKY